MIEYDRLTEVQKQFFCFLQEHDSLRLWLHYCDDIESYLSEPAHKFIIQAFAWSSTLEGTNYWAELHRAWMWKLVNEDY